MTKKWLSEGHTNKANAASGLAVDTMLMLPATGTHRSFHIVADAIEAGESGPLLSEGVVLLPKDSAASFAFGEAVFVAATPVECLESASGLYEIGYCVDEAGALAGTTVCRVKLYGIAVEAVA